MAEREGLTRRNTGSTNQNQQKADSGPSMFEGAITKVLLVIIILLLISLPLVIIKFNIGGVGESARPFLENVKYVERVLPPKPDPNDPKYMSKAELIEKYITFKDDNARLIQENDRLKSENDALNDIKLNNQALLDKQAQLQKDNEQLAKGQQQLELDRNKFYEDIKNEKKTEFKEYFEKINKEKAEELYREIITGQKAQDQIKEYVSYYEKMDSDSAAAIFNEMTKTKMDLVVSILKAMKKEQAAAIMEGMDPNAAAKVSDKLSKAYQVNE